MGYRSVFITEDMYMELPVWFYDKYKDSINFGNHVFNNGISSKSSFPLSSKSERKFYQGAKDEMFIDLSKVIEELQDDFTKSISLLLLHEDQELSSVVITADTIDLRHQGGYNSQLGESETYIRDVQ